MEKFIRDFVTGYWEVYKRRIHCFILCNWMWKFFTGYGRFYKVYTVSYFVTADPVFTKYYTLEILLYVEDVYTVS